MSKVKRPVGGRKGQRSIDQDPVPPSQPDASTTRYIIRSGGELAASMAPAAPGAAPPAAPVAATRGKRWLRSLVPDDPVRQLPGFAYILGERNLPRDEEAVRIAWNLFGLLDGGPVNSDDPQWECAERARILTIRLQVWVRELRDKTTPSDRRGEIETAIDTLYVALEPTERDNLIRFELAEQFRLVTQYRICEVLAEVAAQHPDRRPVLERSLGRWLQPTGLVFSLVGARWPEIAIIMEKVEAEKKVVTSLLDAWSGVKKGTTNKAVDGLLADLFTDIRRPYAGPSFAAKYREWFRKRAGQDPVGERLALWGRLSMILEEIGFSDQSIARELEGVWWMIARRRAGPPRIGG